MGNSSSKPQNLIKNRNFLDKKKKEGNLTALYEAVSKSEHKDLQKCHKVTVRKMKNKNDAQNIIAAITLLFEKFEAIQAEEESKMNEEKQKKEMSYFYEVIQDAKRLGVGEKRVFEAVKEMMKVTHKNDAAEITKYTYYEIWLFNLALDMLHNFCIINQKPEKLEELKRNSRLIFAAKNLYVQHISDEESYLIPNNSRNQQKREKIKEFLDVSPPEQNEQTTV